MYKYGFEITCTPLTPTDRLIPNHIFDPYTVYDIPCKLYFTYECMYFNRSQLDIVSVILHEITLASIFRSK